LDLESVHVAIREFRAEIDLTSLLGEIRAGRIDDELLSSFKKVTRDVEGRADLAPIQRAIEELSNRVDATAELDLESVHLAIREFRAEMDLTSLLGKIREGRIDDELLSSFEKLSRDADLAPVLRAIGELSNRVDATAQLDLESVHVAIQEFRAEMDLTSLLGEIREGRIDDELLSSFKKLTRDVMAIENGHENLKDEITMTIDNLKDDILMHLTDLHNLKGSPLRKKTSVRLTDDSPSFDVDLRDGGGSSSEEEDFSMSLPRGSIMGGGTRQSVDIDLHSLNQGGVSAGRRR